MAIAKEVDFEDGVTPVSEAWLDLIQEFIASYVSPNFTLEAQSTTVVRVPAGNNHESVAIAIGGQMRRIDANVSSSVSGSPGTKIIYATADSGDDVFALEVTDGSPAATLFRKVGEVDWSGTVITSIRREYPLGAGQGPGANVPIGGGFMWFTDVPPENCIFADGSAISRTTFSELFDLWGTTYGAGNGTTTFGTPDLRQRFPLGKSASGVGATIGEQGGAISHVHAGPSHTHAGPSHAHTNPNTSTAATHVHSQAHAHNQSPMGTGGTSQTAVGQEGGGSTFQYVIAGHTHVASGGTTGGVNTANTGAGGGHAHSQGNTGAGGTGNTGAGGTGNTGGATPAYHTVQWAVRAL